MLFIIFLTNFEILSNVKLVFNNFLGFSLNFSRLLEKTFFAGYMFRPLSATCSQGLIVLFLPVIGILTVLS